MRTRSWHVMILCPLTVLALLAVRTWAAHGDTMAPPAPVVTGYAATNPHGVALNSAPPGAPILIEGTDLGQSGTLSFGLDAANGPAAPAAVTWLPTEILTTVPSAPSYPFTVTLTLVTSGQRVAGPAFTITQPVVARDNLLINGGFELPDASGSASAAGYSYGAASSDPGYQGSSFPGWRIAAGSVRLVPRAWAAAEGSQSLALVGPTGAGTIEQTLYVLPGQDYLLSGFISHDPTVAAGRAQVFINEAQATELTDNGPVPADKSRWRPFTYRFTAPFVRGANGLLTVAIMDTTGLGAVGGTDLDGLTVTLAPPVPQAPTPPQPSAPCVVQYRPSFVPCAPECTECIDPGP